MQGSQIIRLLRKRISESSKSRFTSVKYPTIIINRLFLMTNYNSRIKMQFKIIRLSRERRSVKNSTQKATTSFAIFGWSKYIFTISGKYSRYRGQPSVLIIHRLFEYITSPDTKPRADARRKPGGDNRLADSRHASASATRARASTLNSKLSADPLTFSSIRDAYLQPAIRPGVGLSRHAGEIPSAQGTRKGTRKTRLAIRSDP